MPLRNYLEFDLRIKVKVEKTRKKEIVQVAGKHIPKLDKSHGTKGYDQIKTKEEDQELKELLEKGTKGGLFDER